MNIHLNERMIARRSKIGRWVSTGGLIVLVIGMIATFRGPQYTWVSFGALLVGLIASQVGTYYMRRWGRVPRPDEVLAASLKGLDRRYHFYAWLLPAEYVLLGPAGLFVFVTRDQARDVTYQNGRWRQPFHWSRLLTAFSGEGMGSPDREAEGQLARLARLVSGRLSEDETASIPMQGVVVFLAENVQLELIDEPPVPVLHAKQVKDHIRGLAKGDKLSADLRERLAAIFDAEVQKKQ